MEAYREIDAMGREIWVTREAPEALQLQCSAKSTNDLEEDEIEQRRR